MKKTLILLCAAVMVFNACAKNNTKEAAQATVPAPFEMVIIESAAAPGTGMEDPALTQGLEMFVKAPAKVTKVDYASAKEDAAFAGLNLGYMPLYLIKRTEATVNAFQQHINAGMLQLHGDYIVFERQTRQGVFMDKAAQTKTLEVFVMSQCPYGAMAENKIIEARKAGKLPKDIKIKLRFVAQDAGDGTFRSLHGTAEWEEDIRQIIIQKYYPSLLWKYLEIRNKDYMSSRWDKALKAAGIDASKIDARWKEGVELLKKDAAYAQEYGVGASPTFLWEGRAVLDFGTVSKIEGLEFLDPQAQSGGAAPAAAPGAC